MEPSSSREDDTPVIPPSFAKARIYKHQVPLCLQDVGHVTKRPSRANRRSDLLARSILPTTLYPSVVPGPYIPKEYSHIVRGAPAPPEPEVPLPRSDPSRTSSTSDDHRSKLIQETPTPTPSSISFADETTEETEQAEMDQDQDQDSSNSFVTTEKTKMSEKKFLEEYFGADVREASKKDIPFEDIGWCQISETRLLKRLIVHKPAGVFQELEYSALVNDMNRIAENDALTDYRNELTPEDYELYLKRVESGEAKTKPRCYEPAYKVRPNVTAIKNKLSEYYDLSKVHEMELAANPIQAVLGDIEEFQLPPELLKLRDSGRKTS